MLFERLLNRGEHGAFHHNIIQGFIDTPKYTITAPADLSFGFPPVLLPLWSNAALPGYIGLAKHWFGSRPDSYVKFYSGEFQFKEIARNPIQLKSWLTFDFLCNVPDIREVGEFSESIGYCPENKIESLFKNCNDEKELRSLPEFQSNPPLAVSSNGKQTHPTWVTNNVTQPDVEQSIAHGDYEKAWYQLNSSPIPKDITLKLLQQLLPHAEDQEGFSQLISDWGDHAYLQP
jgi:hypothetical protein